MTTPSGLIGPTAVVGEWSRFRSRGFADSVRGLVIDGQSASCCGVSLGGLGTGSLDVLPDGLLGFSTLFPSRRRHPDKRYQPVYRNPQLLLPFLGLSVDKHATLLAAGERIRGGRQTGCIEPGMGRDLVENGDWVDAWSVENPAVTAVKAAQSIRYWGHYPMVDIDYEIPGPISVSLRAWSPLILGDIDASNTPGAAFEVELRNTDAVGHDLSVCFSFPGILDSDPPVTATDRSGFHLPGLNGVAVSGSGFDYTIAIVGNQSTRSGFGVFGDVWAEIGDRLPEESCWDPRRWTGIDQVDTSSSVAADLHLDPGASETVTFLLTWNAPVWKGGGFEDIEGFDHWDPGEWLTPGRKPGERTVYRSRYADRFGDSEGVAEGLAGSVDSLRSRLIGWQSTIYAEAALPDWLPDVLINSLNMLTKNSFWASPSDSLGQWSYPLGAFGMSESPRGCDVTGCIVSNWYGDFPMLFFFPELELATLRNYRAYVRPDGAVPFLYPSRDLTRPSYEWLIPLNGPCYVDLVGRLWRRTEDISVLWEFYPSVKKNVEFTIGLRGGVDGVVGVHMDGTGQEWWEHTPVKGLVTHAAGVRLATVSIAEEMARAIGDHEFADWCAERRTRGSEIVEGLLWGDGSYLFFYDPATEERNDDILSSQLDGDWIAGIHGMSHVFDRQRAEETLSTIVDRCSVPCGVLGFVPHDKQGKIHLDHTVPSDAASYGSFTAEMQIVAMTMMYAGMVDEGTDLAFRALDNLFRRQGHAWDLPNMVQGETCERYFGTDYFQNLALWALPAAIHQKPIASLWAPDGLVARALEAARLT